jgi:hypothetical protein
MPRLVVSVLLPLAFLTLAPPPASAEAALVTRVQVFFDPSTGTVQRRAVRLADPEPALALDFRWEPAAGAEPGLDAEGRAEGEGRVVWRIPGLSDHDPRGWHHAYEGHLVAGRFEGKGTLRWRDGREMAGQFAAGQLHGPGRIRDGEGNLREGTFVAGLLQGEGTYRSQAGWVWHGPFRDDLMEGDGMMTEPGGVIYPLTMRAGEPASAPPDRVFAGGHPLIGGLRPAQGGPSMADRSQIAVQVDQRLSADQWAPYTETVEAGDVIIYPGNDSMAAIWNADPSGIGQAMLMEGSADDWNESRALTVFSLSTADGAPVRIEDLRLNVEQSVPYLRPFLIEESHLGCVPFQPSFQIENHGWGLVQNPRLRVRFAPPEFVDWENPAATATSSDWIDVPLVEFDEGTDVDLYPALAALGVDPLLAQNSLFSCPGMEALELCRQDALRSGLYGRLAPFMGGEGGKMITTTLLGEITYDWTDAYGSVQTDTRPLRAEISLGFIDATGPMAECGAGGAWPTEARQFLDVELPPQSGPFTVDLPMRGNPEMASLAYGVKFWSPRSSIHVMQAEAVFADGSSRLSPRTILYFLNPRSPAFQSSLVPASCTLSAADTGIC